MNVSVKKTGVMGGGFNAEWLVNVVSGSFGARCLRMKEVQRDECLKGESGPTR